MKSIDVELIKKIVIVFILGISFNFVGCVIGISLVELKDWLKSKQIKIRVLLRKIRFSNK